MTENREEAPTVFLNREELNAFIQYASEGDESDVEGVHESMLEGLRDKKLLDHQGMTELARIILYGMATSQELIETVVTTKDGFTRTSGYNGPEQSTIVTTQGGDSYRLMALSRAEMIMHFADALRLLAQPVGAPSAVYLPQEFVSAALLGECERLETLLRNVSAEDETFLQAVNGGSWSVHAGSKVVQGEEDSVNTELFIGLKVGGRFFLVDLEETESGCLAVAIPPMVAWFEISSWFAVSESS